MAATGTATPIPEVSSRLVLILADMVEAALKGHSGERADGVQCEPKVARRNGAKA